SVGALAVPISRDSLSGEIEVYEEDMLRPFVNQDAILGHVASRGDRHPRGAELTPCRSRCQSGYARSTHEQFNARKAAKPQPLRNLRARRSRDAPASHAP